METTAQTARSENQTDWRDKKIAFEVIHTRAVDWVRFSKDEQLVYSLGGDEFIVSSLAEKRPAITVKGVEGARSAAVHPSGNFVVLAFQGGLAIIDLKTGTVTKPLAVNRGIKKIDRWTNLPDEAVVRHLRENPQKLKKMGVKSQEELQTWITKNRFIEFETNELVFDVGFSPDGKRLFVASNGMRVLDWEKVLAATGDAPAPELSVDAPRDDENDPNSRPLAYCVRLDSDRNLLLSSCLAGVVQYLDLATGKSGTLLEAPGNAGIWRLELTRNRAALCCHSITRPNRKDLSQKSLNEIASFLQIWNYPALCKAAGLD